MCRNSVSLISYKHTYKTISENPAAEPIVVVFVFLSGTLQNAEASWKDTFYIPGHARF